MDAKAVEPATGFGTMLQLMRYTAVEFVPSLMMDMSEIDGKTLARKVDELKIDRHRRRRGVASENVVAENPAAYGIEIICDKNG